MRLVLARDSQTRQIFCEIAGDRIDADGTDEVAGWDQGVRIFRFAGAGVTGDKEYRRSGSNRHTLASTGF